MFLVTDIRKISSLVRTDIGPTDVFDRQELDAVGQAQKLMVENLFVPKHSRPLQTLILKKYFTLDFNLGEFVRELSNRITGSFHIRIGASFFLENVQEDLVRYFFSIYGRPVNPDNQIMKDYHDIDDLCKVLNDISNDQLLKRLYDDINYNPFDKSGFTVRRLALATFWITQVNGSI